MTDVSDAYTKLAALNEEAKLAFNTVTRRDLAMREAQRDYLAALRDNAETIEQNKLMQNAEGSYIQARREQVAIDMEMKPLLAVVNREKKLHAESVSEVREVAKEFGVRGGTVRKLSDEFLGFGHHDRGWKSISPFKLRRFARYIRQWAESDDNDPKKEDE